MAFVVEAHCVFCKVRTEMLYIMWISSVFKDGATGQVVSVWPLTAEVKILFWARPCKIYGVQTGNGTGFSAGISIFPCQSHTIKVPYLSASTCCSDRMDRS
jgi:hypothetical protein